MSSPEDYRNCLELPPKMGSRGAMASGYIENYVMQYAVPQFMLQFIVIFIFNKSFHYFIKPFGFTSFTSQFLSGVIIGKSMLGRKEGEHKVEKLLFPKYNLRGSHSEEILDAESLFAYTFFLFIMGVKMDMKLIWRVGRNAWVIGITSILFPMIAGLSTIEFILHTGRHPPQREAFQQAVVLVSTQSFCTFPVISSVLHDLKLLNTELGRLALSASVVSNAFSTSFAVVISSLMGDKAHNIVYTAALIIVLIFVLRPAMEWVARNTPEGEPIKEVYLNILVILVFMLGYISQYLGQPIFFGPLVFGLTVPEGPPLGSALVDKIETFFHGILLPIYVTSTVAKINLTTVFADPLWTEINIISIVFAVKMVACLLPPLLCKVPFRDCLVLSLILNCKGVVELATYNVVHLNASNPKRDQAGKPMDKIEFDENRLALGMVVTFVLATVMPFAIRRIYTNTTKYGGYQQRNLAHLKPDSELPVLVCIHRSDNIVTSINLLDSFCPAPDRPIKIYALHFVKLVGQFVPSLAAHHKQKPGRNKSKSDNMIAAFKEFEETRSGAVHLNLFTAMSEPKAMPEEICRLALDKNVSLILLSFHKRWSKAGLISLEDTTVQAVNSIVLDRAPCSVAMIIDLGYLNQPMSRRMPLCVGLFFMGGNDDREAAILAKRMGKDRNIPITVVHLCIPDRDGSISWDRMMDDEVLNDVKHGKCGDNIRYVKQYVEDGPQTAVAVKSMADQFNLMIVGRHRGKECSQTTGLKEWMELRELGILGDLIATSETPHLTSLLVVQQQTRS